MKLNRLSAVLLCVLLVTGMAAYGHYRQTTTAGDMTAAAKMLLAALSPQQRALVQTDYGSPDRVGWHFIPKKHRKGLPLKDMSPAQRKLALSLVRAALSQAGYDKATAIMQLERVLAAIEGQNGGGRHSRDPLRYYLTLFGKPDISDRWGLSFEGHHLSLNFVVQGDRVVSSTPQFLAANPAIVRDSYLPEVKRGTQVLKGEESLGFDLVRSLSAIQRNKAILSDRAPRDIRHGGEPQPPAQPPAGLAAAEMTDRQQELLSQLLEEYLSAMPRDVAAARRRRMDTAGLEKIYFAWAGATEPQIGHYYRVQGPTLLIEFVNTQPDSAGNPANHVHCVWRDPTGDFALPADGS